MSGAPGRIGTVFSRLKREGRTALIPYVTAGFPYADITPELMHGMVAAGANVIELGVPFSDPSADGAVIQKAGDQALAAGVGLVQVLEMVHVFRQTDTTTPVVLMGYANPVERYDQRHRLPDGASAFVRDAAAAGVDGMLIVDYPPEECVDFAAELRRHGLDLIFLLAPTSTEQRMGQVAAVASGYVYYVSLKGVTGAGTLDTAAVEAVLPRIRKHVKLPLGVGFGIRDAQSACAVARVADAVVIGSKIIQLIDALPRDQVVAAAHKFLKQIRSALDAQSNQNAPAGQPE
jgi:tryptophan synthase alpha chain